ncbi:MAG: hypothetical protein E7489_03505 [Ruminococcaceae bacterium]|nr:hypothetical protein [Oscillospiraceae bacterium]
MKKVVIPTKILFIICVSLIMLCLICNFCYNIWFRETYLQSSSLVSLKTDVIEEINLNSGKIETKSFSANNIDLCEINLVTNGKNIFRFADNKWIEIPISGYKIEEKPVIINDAVYFVAPDPTDTEEFPDYFIWKYQNGEIIKFHEKDLIYASTILAYNDCLIFCEKNGYLKSNIIEKNVITGEERKLAAGNNICWKTNGEELFFDSPYYGLSLLNIVTGKIVTIDSDVNLLASPVYNSNEQILFIIYENPKNPFSYLSFHLGFYYLDSNKYISCWDYFEHINFAYDENTFPDLAYVYWN